MSNDHDGGQSLANALESKLRDITRIQRLTLKDGVRRLPGGFDTETYAFALEHVPEELRGGLVLRRFRSRRETHRVIVESAIQNAVADAGHPVPDVPFDTAGLEILGSPFMVMRRMPGVTLAEMLLSDPANVAQPAAVLMGATQARLHGLDPRPAIRALREAGPDPAERTPIRNLVDMRRMAGVTGHLPALRLVEWLESRLPGDPSAPSICHGDFHPGNILVEEMRLTGVIDWANFSFGHADYDVAVTRFIISVGLMEDPPVPVGQLRQMVAQFLVMYDGAYAKHQAVDEGLVEFYTVLRAGHALVKIAAARYRPDVRGAAHDGYAWSRPAVYEAVRALVLEKTGIDFGPITPGTSI